MVEQGFREWLVQKSWAQGVYYSKAVAWLLPPAALAADAPYFGIASQHWPPGFAGLLAWQLTAELFFIVVALAPFACQERRADAIGSVVLDFLGKSHR